MIVALAGRRIDAPGTTPPGFPPDQVDRVRADLVRTLRAAGVRALVASAACGADLLGLEVAETLGARRRIVLPFERSHFKTESVTDRPGDWGKTFERLVDAANAAGDLVVLGLPHSDDAYARTNVAILDDAARLARTTGDTVLSVAVWDRQSRGPDDLTEHFLQLAKRHGAIQEIDTRPHR
jgi:hypothetical protein